MRKIMLSLALTSALLLSSADAQTNIFNPATISVGNLIDPTQGHYRNYGGNYFATDACMVGGPGQYVSNVDTSSGVGTGWAFYSSSGSIAGYEQTIPPGFISGVAGGPANTPVTAPVGTTCIRVGFNGGNAPNPSAIAATIMVVAGTTLPGSYVPYVPPPLPSPTLNFAAIPGHLYSDGPFTPLLTTNSSSAPTIVVTSGPATISGKVVTLTGNNGTVVLTGSVSSDGTYSAASAVTSFAVTGAPLGGVAFTTVTLGNLINSGGIPLAHGRVCFTPVNNQGVAIAATWSSPDGATGVINNTPVCWTITNGFMQSGVKLIKSSLTSPLNLIYQMTIANSVSGIFVVSPKDGFQYQPTADTLELSTVHPNLPGLVVQSVGAQGAPGLSAYQLYQQSGGLLSQAAWLESLKGAPGTGTARTRWYGKKVGFTGDSILAYGSDLTIPPGGSPSANNGNFSADGTQPAYFGLAPGFQVGVRDQLNMTVVMENGASGLRAVDFFTDARFTSYTNAAHVQSADLWFLSLGTNDFQKNIPLGTISDTLASQSFYGAMHQIIAQFFTWNPAIKLIVSTPAQAYGGGWINSSSANATGHTQQEYVNAIQQVAAQYSVYVVDLFKNCGYNPLTIPTLSADGLHPLPVGYAACWTPQMVSAASSN